jgi:hypothetical protein
LFDAAEVETRTLREECERIKSKFERHKVQHHSRSTHA